MEVSCREEKTFCPVRDVKKLPKSSSSATLPKSIAELFGKEEQQAKKQRDNLKKIVSCESRFVATMERETRYVRSEATE